MVSTNAFTKLPALRIYTTKFTANSEFALISLFKLSNSVIVQFRK